MLRQWLFIISDIPGKIKRRIWNKHLLLWWCKLWIRKDEFHWTLSLDTEAMMEMNPNELRKYREDVVRRRSIAHERDF